MGAQPGDCSNEGSYTLISHMEDNITNEESMESIAQHFALISQEYPPLDRNLLLEQLKAKLEAQIIPEMLPDILDYKVYEQIKRSKKPTSSVPGDLPRRIVQEFGPELAQPAGEIYRNIVRTGHWPKQWRVEYGTQLQKTEKPHDGE